jgi:hypothetical protein
LTEISFAAHEFWGNQSQLITDTKAQTCPRTPPCQIVADAAFLEPLKVGLKVLTHPLKDPLGSGS